LDVPIHSSLPVLLLMMCGISIVALLLTSSGFFMDVKAVRWDTPHDITLMIIKVE
jgi:hypothetical protein